MKPNNNFPIVFWGDDASTKAQFHPCETIPKNALVTSCMVCVIHDDKLLLTKPPRGWGLPGGRLEPGEAPEDCARREVYEEAAVRLGNLKLIGAWYIEKLFRSEHNERYPDQAHQLLFLANTASIDDFVPSHESSARNFVKFDDVCNYHHDFENFADILEYVVKIAKFNKL